MSEGVGVRITCIYVCILCVWNVCVCLREWVLGTMCSLNAWGCVCIYISRCFMYVCTCIYVYVYLCVLVAYCSDSDSLVRSELGNGRFRFVPVMDPIQMRFENWPIGWFGDLYRFVQWRPDHDSDSKSRNFIWAFALVLFPHLPLSVVHIYVTCFILCNHLLYFTSMIICITSWGTSEILLYLFSWYECYQRHLMW